MTSEMIFYIGLSIIMETFQLYQFYIISQNFIHNLSDLQYSSRIQNLQT
jgi:hypothetical protein